MTALKFLQQHPGAYIVNPRGKGAPYIKTATETRRIQFRTFVDLENANLLIQTAILADRFVYQLKEQRNV